MERGEEFPPPPGCVRGGTAAEAAIRADPAPAGAVPGSAVSGGLLGEVSRLLNDAAEAAIRDGSERITLGHLRACGKSAVVIDPGLWRIDRLKARPLVAGSAAWPRYRLTVDELASSAGDGDLRR